MKLRGIASSKGRLAAHRRALERAAAARDANTHRPTLAENGAIRCSCNPGLPYSPAAFAEHLDGKQPRDSEGGAYVTGPSDPWCAKNAPAEPAQNEDGELRVDTDGSQWRAFMDEFKRRAWRNAANGEVRLDTSLFVVRPEREQTGVGGMDDSGTIFG